MGLCIRKNRGFTLVEILITMAVVSIIMVAVISAFNIQQKSQVKQQLIAEVQQNGRAAMYMLARDIRMASFGLGDGEVTYWDGLTYNSYRAVRIVDGGTNQPDRIEILYATPVDLTATSGAVGVNALTTAIVLLSDDNLNVDNVSGFQTGDTVIITNGSYSSLLEVTNIVPPSLEHDPDTGLTPPINPPLGQQITTKGPYDVGSSVYKLRYLTYIVSNADPSHPVMQVDRTGPRDGDQFATDDTIAEDIEDLQAAYIFEDGFVSINGAYDPPGSNHDYAHIRAVRVSVLARTRAQNVNFSGGRRPKIENRQQGASDSYGRRLLTLELKIRNFGL